MQQFFDFTQRWREGRHRFVPSGELIRTQEYDVEAIAEDSIAKAFVTQHHYSQTYPSARFRYGLYRQGRLVGVAVFSHPVRDEVLTSVFPGRAIDSVELGRFVLLDEVAGNGETWFLGQCFRRLKREQLHGVVSFSDPIPRSDANGLEVFPGHLGIIYQAHNGAYLGRGSAGTLMLKPDGRALNRRALQKIRAGSKGWQYAAKQLEPWAPPAPSGQAARQAWLNTWLPRVTRSLRHPGNHKYAWRFGRPMVSLAPYPKRNGPQIGANPLTKK